MVVELETDPLRAVDVAKRSVAVRGRFERADAGPALSLDVDCVTHVTATTLRFADAYVVVNRLDTDERTEFGRDVGTVRLGEAPYRLRIALPVSTYVRFDAPVTIRSSGTDTLSVEFDEATTVTLGFRSRTKHSGESVTAPPTPEGVAATLSRFAAGHTTATPDRSFPSLRPHPPTVSFSADASLPAPSFDADDPTIVVPPTLDALLTVAPLAYYLGARVRTESGAAPTLLAADRHRLGAGADARGVGVETRGDDTDDADGADDAFETRVAEVLRRTFYLDCVVRNAGPNGTELVENAALDRLDIDPDRLYEAGVCERVSTYLDAEYPSVADLFPEWHLSLYLDDDLQSVRALPYVLYNVPQVFRPRARPLEGDEWLSRSLDDFYRARESESVDLVNPDLGPGRTHGWLAEETPIDVFKTTLRAYQNRARHWRDDEESVSIVAVVNDQAMAAEGTAAASVYRRRAEELDLDVTVREGLTVDELATTFEGTHEFVHFIGHCEPAGLVCADGHFDASTVADSNVQTFFLNACGSYSQGSTLVEKGSVVGGATFNRVLDGNAARVGSSFAQLLMRGFCFERALSVARRRIMSGKDYVVVGDGTHSLTQMNGLIGSVLRVDSTADDYRVVQDVYSPGVHGGVYQTALQDDELSQLYGNPREFRFGVDELREVLGNAEDTPVVFDGDLRWGHDVATLLE